MKKRLFLTVVMIFVFALMLTFAVSADSVHNANTVDYSATVTLSNGTVLNLFDKEGNALIWYKDSNSETGYSSVCAQDARWYAQSYGTEVKKWTAPLNAEGNEMFNIKNTVVINLMDDDVVSNFNNGNTANDKYMGSPLTVMKELFQYNTTLEYLFFRLDTTNINGNICTGCTKLKYVNLAELTSLKKMSLQNHFSGCTSLFDGQVLDLSKTKLTEFENQSAFKAVPLKGIKFPSTMTKLGTATTFQNCTKLEFISVGSKVKVPGDAFSGCTSLKAVYFVGTEDELSVSTFVTALPDATIKSYSEYMALSDKSGVYLVYGYSACDAFNNSKHEASGNVEMQKITNYFAPITFADTCSLCFVPMINESMTMDAIFTYYGYSCTEEAIGGAYSMSQFYGVDKDALYAYTSLTGNTFTFGLIASGVANPFEYVEGELTVADKAVVKDSETFAHDFFGVKINGMTEANLKTAIVFCAYVIDNGEVFYLDNDTTVTEITGINYATVYATLNGTNNGDKEEE